VFLIRGVGGGKRRPPCVIYRTPASAERSTTDNKGYKALITDKITAALSLVLLISSSKKLKTHE
jgi:hypothetical protein